MVSNGIRRNRQRVKSAARRRLLRFRHVVVVGQALRFVLRSGVAACGLTSRAGGHLRRRVHRRDRAGGAGRGVPARGGAVAVVTSEIVPAYRATTPHGHRGGLRLAATDPPSA